MWGREGRDLPHVCLCKKRNGQTSFPKGALGSDGVFEGAKREWSEETGISTDRLRFVRGAHLDEAHLGCRYLLAQCEAPSPSSGEPDEEAMVWRPPFEDPSDPDPIVQAQWISLRHAREGRSRLSRDRVGLLERAIVAAEEAELLRQQEDAQRECLRVAEQARRVAADQAEPQRAQEEALRVAAREGERLRVAEQARRLAAEEAERQRQEEEARRVAAEEAERLRQQDEAQRERLRVEEQARRVAAEEAERQRKPEEALRVAAREGERLRVEKTGRRVAAEGAERLLPPGFAAPPATGRAASPRPMKIIDSRFEKERCARAICCDECGDWYRGNAVGTFSHTRGMPAAEFRRAAWERGDWDASWYCIECCAEYWECSEQEVMEYLGFSKRQSRKDQFMSTRAVSASTGPANPPKARKPASIADTRFEKKRELRKTRCDQCNELKGGNEAGAFCHRQNMPLA